MPAAAVPAATAAPSMQIGIYDEGETFFGDPDAGLRALQGAARRRSARQPLLGRHARRREARPFQASDPRDAAYDWALYDRTVHYAAPNGIKVLFSITGTPRWANGGQTPNRPPTNYATLRDFAYAAAARYSGTYVGDDGRTLPAVRLWAAWNEPNNPAFLRPQFVKRGAKWVIQSAISTTRRSATRSTTGVHATLFADEQVACGVTAPRGNNNPTSARPSVSPLAFLTRRRRRG